MKKDYCGLKSLLVTILVMACSIKSVHAWNHTESTELGFFAYGTTKVLDEIVLNWRSADNSSSLQSFYLSIPANSVLDVYVSCTATESVLGMEVVPNTIGFSETVSLPVGMTKIGRVQSGATAENIQVHMHYKKTQWGFGTFVAYASLKLVCRGNGNTSNALSVKNPRKVTFDARGGTGGISRYVSSGTAVGSLPKPNKKGYRFKGWYTKKSGGSKITKKTKVKRSVTYYAQWKANKYKIKFNANGGRGRMSTLSATYGKKVELKANAFKRSKCEFIGWATSNDGAVVYKNKEKVKNLTAKNGKTVTLYAVWRGTGGSGTGESGGSSAGGSGTGESGGSSAGGSGTGGTGGSSAGGSGTGGTGGSAMSDETWRALQREYWMSQYRMWLGKAERQMSSVRLAEEVLQDKINSGSSYSIALLNVQSQKRLYDTYIENANRSYLEALKY